MAMAAVMQAMAAPPPRLRLTLRLLLLLSLPLPIFLSQENPLFSPFDADPTTPFLRFQRSFLLLVFLSAGLGSVFGEQKFADYGIGREQMAMYQAAGAAAALFFGSFSGIVSDIIGPRKACMIFCILHLLVGVLKSMSRHPSIWITNICLALASSVSLFCFEAWMVTEHEKQGHRQDLLNNTFWLMTFFESASLIGSQGLANWLVKDPQKGYLSPAVAAALMATISILYIRKGWKGDQHKYAIENYRKSFAGHILKDKKVWLLAWAQTSIYFSLSVFWVLWAPTIVVIHSPLFGIVGGWEGCEFITYIPMFPGFKNGWEHYLPMVIWSDFITLTDDCLIYAFIVACVSLLIVAYDYQEIGFLVVLFCVFHACVGFILPSLARLRTIYVPNELRGGMMSVSLAPASAALWFIMIQGGCYHNIENATIFALAAFGLLSSAGCIHVLRWWRKRPHQNWHKR